MRAVGMDVSSGGRKAEALNEIDLFGVSDRPMHQLLAICVRTSSVLAHLVP